MIIPELRIRSRRVPPQRHVCCRSRTYPTTHPKAQRRARRNKHVWYLYATGLAIRWSLLRHLPIHLSFSKLQLRKCPTPTARTLCFRSPSSSAFVFAVVTVVFVLFSSLSLLSLPSLFSSLKNFRAPQHCLATTPLYISIPTVSLPFSVNRRWELGVLFAAFYYMSTRIAQTSEQR